MVVFHLFFHKSPIKSFKESVYYRKDIISMASLYLMLVLLVAGVAVGAWIIHKYVTPYVEGYDNKAIAGGLGSAGIGSIPVLFFAFFQKSKNRKNYLNQVYADTQSKKWQLAVSAIYALQNGGKIDEKKERKNSFERLDMCQISFQEREKYRRILREWWGSYTRDELLKTLDWLLHEGHRQQFDQMEHLHKTMSKDQIFELLKNSKEYQAKPELLKSRIRVAEEAKNGYSSSGIVAWDMVRLGYVVRMAYCADYITSQEAWNYLSKATKITQQSFSSWKEMMESWELGRNFWAYDQKANFKPLIDKLLYEAESPWQKLSWRTQLL